MIEDEVKRCACGHDRGHQLVSPEPTYGGFGWLKLLLGVTAVPTLVTFRCRTCRAVIEEIDDPRFCESFV